VTVAGGDSCSEPLGPTVPISGWMVRVVAPDTSQLSVVCCAGLMLNWLAVKELITGGAVGSCGADVGGGAAPSLTTEMQPAAEPIKTISDTAISIQYHLYSITKASVFVAL